MDEVATTHESVSAGILELKPFIIQESKEWLDFPTE